MLSSLALAAACRRPAPPPAPKPRPTPAPEYRWARASLERLTLAQKAAQLIGVRASGLYRHPDSAEARRLRGHVKDLGVGSVVVFDSEVESLPRLLNGLQRTAEVPLLVAADTERGMAFRIRRGVVPLPYAMGVGATRSEEAARFTGQVAAREARALGVHWAFAPVADVNSNPDNPVINIRSYGEDPELAASLSAAFIRGAREGGVLTTAKHFPGHGDTSVDTHLQLATIEGDRARLDAIEMVSFRRAVEAGVDSVMLGHIAVPALDPTGAPAGFSAPIVDVLRVGLGFKGLVVTDALDMAGARAAWTGDAVIRSVQAGADVILLPPDPTVAVQALVRAVREGQISEARLGASVLRILEAKERLGLGRDRLVDAGALAKSVARPDDLERALGVARSSITVVRNEGGVLPLHAEAPLRLLHLVLSSDIRNDAIQGFPEEELGARCIPTETVGLGPEVSEETATALLARAKEFTHVLASCFVRVTASKGTADMSPSHARLLRALAAVGKPVVVVSYGSPYLLRQFPEVPVYLCAYGGAESSQRAALGALFGEYAVGGKLPVTLPGLYPYGHGLEIPRHAMTLREARPEQVGFRPDGMAAVDELLDRAVLDKVSPGGVIAVGKDGALVHLRPFGAMTYEIGARAVVRDTLYDLASLTKVVATATMAMILVDEGKLDVTKPVSAFVPAFKGGAKDKVTLEHLLTHSAGLAAHVPLYKELSGKQAFVERIAGMDLAYEPGTKALYSDLGEILLGEVLERVAGESLDEFARRRIFAPLGMKETGFRPGPHLLPRIAPTEQDPWRGRLVHGEVQDENAYAMGGVAPHAGLFGTAGDLSRFAQMMLDGGVFEHHRLASRDAVERFTRRAGVPGSSRALGWDTPSPGSSAGTLLSPRSFGHTGFTGTSIWIDPERRLFVILLTNRVYPTRDNDAHLRLRPALADAVVRALAQP